MGQSTTILLSVPYSDLAPSIQGGFSPYSFSIEPETGLVEINEYGLIVEPEETTTYELTVVDAIGSTATLI